MHAQMILQFLAYLLLPTLLAFILQAVDTLVIALLPLGYRSPLTMHPAYRTITRRLTLACIILYLGFQISNRLNTHLGHPTLYQGFGSSGTSIGYEPIAIAHTMLFLVLFLVLIATGQPLPLLVAGFKACIAWAAKKTGYGEQQRKMQEAKIAELVRMNEAKIRFLVQREATALAGIMLEPRLRDSEVMDLIVRQSMVDIRTMIAEDVGALLFRDAALMHPEIADALVGAKEMEEKRAQWRTLEMLRGDSLAIPDFGEWFDEHYGTPYSMEGIAAMTGNRVALE